MCFSLLFQDSLSSGDDEDYDEDPEDAGNANGESFLYIYIKQPQLTSDICFMHGSISV